ncbi:MAG: hypothetical protein M1838_006172 [Thelocarpon superellum]|nr:MAG: hypothetical protein M1838_006172 [Thelocarpon superellum]
MASPATATPASSSANASANDASMSATHPTIGGTPKQNLKSSAAGKPAPDGNRRPSGSPVDGAQRRNSTHKAWTQGTNPITQRSSIYPQSNGVVSSPKGPLKSTTSSSVRETNTPNKHANDRMIFLLANFIGRRASITVSNGNIFTGIFSGASLDAGESAWVLRMTQQTKQKSVHQANGVDDSAPDYIGSGPEHIMSFETKDVIDVAVNGVAFTDAPSRGQNGVSAGFRTDADISGNLTMRERNLQRWEPSADVGPDMSLETSHTQTSGTSGGWDQFEANERLYGVKSDYDEGIYTTTIDRSNPQYRQRLARAEKIAREIEGGNTLNPHVAEERGRALVDDSGMDEEEKYSGVHRGPAEVQALPTGQSNKYTPPARRPPTGQPTVPGAPVDPAIISSQMARPDPTKAATPRPNMPADVATGKLQPPAGPLKGTVPTTPVQGPSAKITPSIKGLPDSSSQRQSISGASSGPSSSSSPNPKPQGGSATATVENDVRDAFKQFANVEKMRVENRRRNVRQHDKDFKLNDLMKWSKGFKLHTPVPKDLVSILAKDKTKQEEIMEKAQREADEAKQETAAAGSKAAATAAATPTVTTGEEAKPQKPTAATRHPATAASTPQPAYPDRSNVGRGRSANAPPGPASYTPQPARPGVGPGPPGNFPMMQGRSAGGMSQRLANNQQPSKAPTPLSGGPSPTPIYDARGRTSGPAAIMTDLAAPPKIGGAATPSSASPSKFNVKALEFRPNPAASTFTPTGNPSAASSPRSVAQARPASRTASPPQFFGERKPVPVASRRSLRDGYNPIKRMRIEAEKSKEDWSANGGIRPAHKTGPRWDVAEENKDKTYAEMFDRAPFSSQSLSPGVPTPSNPPLAHQHQLPFHLQHGAAGMPPTLAPPPAHHHLHVQGGPHPGGPPPHGDDHRMHASASTSSMMASPRLGPAHVAYQSPMNQHAQLVYGQPIPQYGMGPGAPHLAQFRQFPGGPQFVPQPGGQMGAPMMAHGHSNGPYMGVPQGLASPFNHQMPMYSPNQVHAYPHHGGAPPPPPGSSGYPSPGRAAPMMMHQGSQQGQPPQQMMMYGMSPGPHPQPGYAPPQPGQGGSMRGGYPPMPHAPYASSPHQAQHFPKPHRGGPNGTYASSGHGPPTGPHAPPAPMHGHGADAADDGK